MRLLNTTTLQFEEVADSELHLDKNQYAILSHRWGSDEDEVSYADMTSSRDISAKKGFAKIKGFCDLVSSQCRYAWVDTCCINKGNSSELSEAINSMYLWYSESKICIAYLQDVPRKQLVDSEWFDRGWTLQELVAPKVVSFYDQHWNPLGTKRKLVEELSRKTKIPKNILSNVVRPTSCSVAQRMSWAATRVTKRIEDRAYSLLGLFDVNMSMIYGEREKAFLRLQQHIVQKSKDESLFAWSLGLPGDTKTRFSSIYAPSPSRFENCSDIIQGQGSSGFSEKNGELSIELPVGSHSPGIYSAMLCCSWRCERGCESCGCVVSILIARMHDGTFVRVRDLINESTIQTRPTINVGKLDLRFPIVPTGTPETIFFGFWLRTLQPPGHADSEISILSNCPSALQDHISQLDPKQRVTGVVQIRPRKSEGTRLWAQIRWIKFGFDEESNPIIWLGNDSQSDRLHYAFERAVASRQERPKAQLSDVLMNEDIPLFTQYHPGKLSGLYSHQWMDPTFQWREGRAIVRAQRTHRSSITIHTLDTKISVGLQRFPSPTAALLHGDGVSAHEWKPEYVWVIDITTTNERPEPEPKLSCLHACFSGYRKRLPNEGEKPVKLSFDARRIPVLHTLAVQGSRHFISV